MCDYLPCACFELYRFRWRIYIAHIQTNKIIGIKRTQHQICNFCFFFLSFFALRVPLAAGGLKTNLFLSSPSVKMRPDREYKKVHSDVVNLLSRCVTSIHLNSVHVSARESLLQRRVFSCLFCHTVKNYAARKRQLRGANECARVVSFYHFRLHT